MRTSCLTLWWVGSLVACAATPPEPGEPTATTAPSTSTSTSTTPSTSTTTPTTPVTSETGDTGTPTTTGTSTPSGTSTTATTSVTATATWPVTEEDPFCGRKVAGFFPKYGGWRLPITSIEFEHLTEVIFGFMTVDASGGLFEAYGYEVAVLEELVAEAHLHGVEVLVSIDGDFTPMADDTDGSRTAFLVNLLAFIEEHDLDGVDYDWEGEAFSFAERANYSALVSETATLFRPRGLSLSVDTVTWREELNAGALPDLTWMNGMGYDAGPPMHTTLDDGIDVVSHWSARGMHPSRMLMGTGFYGLREDWSALAYVDLLDLYAPPRDEDFTDGYGYCNHACLAEKVRWVVDHGYGGLMIWELSHDAVGEDSLLRTLGETLREACGEFERVVPRGSRWRYHDDGTEPAGTWAEASYDDGGWPVGPAPLGTSGADIATVVSLGGAPSATATYFRHAFEVAAVEEGATWVLGVRADDAAVVFLNGEPLYSTEGLSGGDVAHEALSTVTVRGYDEISYTEVTVEMDGLQEGVNQLAVEVHQASTSGEDLQFDLYLKVRSAG